MKIVVLVLQVFLSANWVHCQLVDVINEVYFESGGMGTIPEGYTTYRIYARLQDSTDRLGAVFGSTPPSPMFHLKIGSSESTNAIWNSPFGGTTGAENNCNFWNISNEIFQGMPYDSYVTIGMESSPTDSCPDCGDETGQVFTISSPAGEVPGTFAVSPLGPDLIMEDGAWFVPNDSTCFSSTA